MSKKTILLLLGIILALLASLSWLLFSDNYLGKLGNKDFSINTNPDFLSASNLLKEKKYEDASNLFSSLENLETNTMQDVAFLRLKKLQIFLAGNEYAKAAETLESIVTNPQFPRGTKGRAIENVLTTYIKNGRDPSLYNAVFSQNTFRTLRKNNTAESVYGLAQYGYDFYPTTILGANVLYSKIENAQKNGEEGSKARTDALEEVAVFSGIFFTESDKEIENLSKQKFQEIALINIYSERSRVIKKLTRLNLSIPNNLSMEDQLISAVKQADILGDPFYTFYTCFNYVDFVSANKKEANPEVEEIIKKKKVFSVGVVQKQWLGLVTLTPISSTTIARLVPYSTDLVQTIEALTK